MKKNSVQNGFTLVELLVVIAILAILSTVSVVGYTNFVKKANISNDTTLINQINTLLNGHRTYETIDDDQSIAKILKNSNITKDINIASQKYDMDIFYNDSKNQFELMSNDDGEAQNFKTLHYYLNLQESEEITPSEKPEVEEDTITFYVNEEYYVKFADCVNNKSKAQKITADVNEGELFIKLAIDENQEFKKTIPNITLSEVITATDSSGILLNLEFKCEPMDLVEEIPHNKDIHYIMNGSVLEVYTPGVYLITATYEDQAYTMNLYVQNIYWAEESKIELNDIIYNFEKINNTVNISNILQGITITDFNVNDASLESVLLTDKKSYSNRITIFIEVGGETIEIQMDQTKSQYSIALDPLDISSDNTISIKFRYQSIAGIYCYSQEQMITVE